MAGGTTQFSFPPIWYSKEYTDKYRREVKMTAMNNYVCLGVLMVSQEANRYKSYLAVN
jgi:hypothetical protein